MKLVLQGFSILLLTICVAISVQANDNSEDQVEKTSEPSSISGGAENNKRESVENDQTVLMITANAHDLVLEDLSARLRNTKSAQTSADMDI